MKSFLLFLATIGLVGSAVLRFGYGGGEPYPDLSTPPILSESALEVALSYGEPIGNVAVSNDGRIFFTVHPESRPQGNRLLEWVNGAAVPFPNGAVQPRLFNTVLGLTVDRQNRLWTIDHGNHGFASPRLLAFDLASGELLHDHLFQSDAAPAGSYLQDLDVSADGTVVYIADASFWRKKPAIVIYDVSSRTARRVLESHESVSAENYLIRTRTRDMTFLAGLISLKGGVDGIALDADNEWLYFAAINHSNLFRVPVAILRDASLPSRQVEIAVEQYSSKPMSDGIRIDGDGNLYVTDVEHGSVMLIGADLQPRTLIQSDRIRWADALAAGPDGWLYLADSAIQDQVLRSREQMQAKAPYFIYRFRPGH